ncbi:hypothetical protein Tco_0120778, partial [Tanacetum coccineum]
DYWVTDKGGAAKSTLIENNPFAPVDTHPLINVFARKPSSEASSSGDLSSAESPYVSQTLHHLGKWSKDHPLDNIIGNPKKCSILQRILSLLYLELLKCMKPTPLFKHVVWNLKQSFLNYGISLLSEKVIVLQEQNELFRAENAKIKQHYKELYDSIKITHAKHIEQTTALTTENENLKAQIRTEMKSVTKDHVLPTILAPGKYVIDVEPIPPRNRNNREVQLDYLRHLKESV